jgi:hypothetical protein
MEEKQPDSYRQLRRPIGYISPFVINIFHMHNPWVVAWWSAAFPGFGFIMLGSYVKGFLFVIWELVINQKTHLNLAIYYSFTGRFDQAKEVLDLNWLLLYVPVYIFGIWLSYRLAVDLNKLTILAKREDSSIIPVKINSWEIAFLDKRVPWLAAVLSLLSPGLGQLYTHRVPISFFLMLDLIVVVYCANWLPALHYTLTGAFSQAAAILDPQWLLYFPSLIGFGIYDAYTNAVQYNRLFDEEQSRFLRKNYQSPNLALALKKIVEDGNVHRRNL